ncbi:MAG: histidine kinase [Bacteroidia bacterium]|nr:histidine kinase [Bacteroidia bacterium]
MSQILRSNLWNAGVLLWVCWMCWEIHQYLPIDISGNIPGTDWIHWIKKDNQIISKEVLYPAKVHESWHIVYPERGSSIKAFDYQNVIDIELLQKLVRNTPVGSYRVYSLAQPESPQNIQTKLIQIHSKPLLEPISSELSWNIRLSLYCILLVGGAMLIALQYPFLRYQPETFTPLYIQTWVFTILISLHGLQLGLCLTDLPVQFAWIWPFLLVLQYILIFILTTVWQWNLLPKWQFGYDLLIWGALGGVGVYFWMNNRFLAIEPIFVRIVVGFSAWKQLQFLSSLTKPKSKLIFGAALLLAAFFIAILTMCSVDFGGDFYQYLEQSHPLTYAFLLAGGMGRVIRFGNIRRVLIQSGAVLVASIIILFIWVGIHKLLKQINLSDDSGVIDIVLLILLLILVERVFLSGNPKGWDSILDKLQLSDSKKWEQFLAEIPKTLNKKTLIGDSCNKIQYLLDAESTQIILKDENSADLTAIFQDIQEWKDDSHWSAISALSTQDLPTKAAPLYFQQKNYVLVLPIRFSSGIAGFLALGKKRMGEYSITDLSYLKQATKSIQSFLEIIQLLEKEETLSKKNLEAELTALRAKINPHFLFNTLNSISELIHTAPDQAEDIVQKLAFVFRHTLEFSSQNFVTLESELQLVQNYLEIEKMRFGERLSFSIDTNSDANECLIPSIMIQTLVENCVKHGISKLVKQGVITLRFWVEEGVLLGKVTDNGPGIDKSRVKKGNGLNNVLTRLETLFPGQNTIQFENTNQGTVVLFSIPQQSES